MQSAERVSGFVPAGGRGERLRPLTDRWAKSALLMGSNGSRLIDYSLTALKGAANTFVSLYAYSETVEDCLSKFKNGKPIILKDSYLGGIGGSFLQHFEVIVRQVSDYILIIPGDHVIEGLDVDKLVDNAVEKKATVAVVLDSGAMYGDRLHYRVEDGFVDRIAKHGESDSMAYTGIALFRSDFLLSIVKKELKTKGNSAVFDITKQVLFPEIVGGKVFVYVLPTGVYWDDAGTISRYYLNNIRLSKGENVVAQNAKIGSRVKIEKTVVLDNVELGGDCRIINAIVAPGTRVNNLRKNSSELSVISS